MNQEEIVNEIRRMCDQTILMPSLGWHFKYNGQVYFYVNYRSGICQGHRTAHHQDFGLCG